MLSQPTLLIDDLHLRAFTADDAPAIQALAGDERIADTTANIPHPWPDGAAQSWLAEVSEKRARGVHLAYAVTDLESGELMGCISLMDIDAGQAELGYWVGVPFWGRGVATSALRAVVDHAFGDMGLLRLHARVLVRNAASARVLLRLGFIHTGCEDSRCGYRHLREPTDIYELQA